MTITELTLVMGVLIPKIDIFTFLLKHNRRALHEALDAHGYTFDELDAKGPRWCDFIDECDVRDVASQPLTSDPEGLIIYNRSHDQDRSETVIMGLEISRITFSKFDPVTDADAIIQIAAKVKKLIAESESLKELSEYTKTIRLYSSQNNCGCCS